MRPVIQTEITTNTEVSMRSLFSVLFALFSSLSVAEERQSLDGTHWDMIGSNRWEMTTDQYGKEAVLTLVREGSDLHFTLTSPCSTEWTFVLNWKHGAKVAKGKGCDGLEFSYPTSRLQGWITPLPREALLGLQKKKRRKGISGPAIHKK